MTDEQRTKAERLRDEAGFTNVTYQKGYIENVACDDASVDAVISNGVFNLAPDKAAVFREVTRVLRPVGRLAIADIVTESQLPDSVARNADLWAACIGGAMQEDDYRTASKRPASSWSVWSPVLTNLSRTTQLERRRSGA